MKIWECSIDLADFIIKMNDTLVPSGSAVLELGCGHGLPGIAAVLKFREAGIFVFTDFNREVFHHLVVIVHFLPYKNVCD